MERSDYYAKYRPRKLKYENRVRKAITQLAARQEVECFRECVTKLPPSSRLYWEGEYPVMRLVERGTQQIYIELDAQSGTAHHFIPRGGCRRISKLPSRSPQSSSDLHVLAQALQLVCERRELPVTQWPFMYYICHTMRTYFSEQWWRRELPRLAAWSLADPDWRLPATHMAFASCSYDGRQRRYAKQFIVRWYTTRTALRLAAKAGKVRHYCLQARIVANLRSPRGDAPVAKLGGPCSETSYLWYDSAERKFMCSLEYPAVKPERKEVHLQTERFRRKSYKELLLVYEQQQRSEIERSRGRGAGASEPAKRSPASVESTAERVQSPAQLQRGELRRPPVLPLRVEAVSQMLATRVQVASLPDVQHQRGGVSLL
jgi:hypothetical protein